jgi:hypothetical protein
MYPIQQKFATLPLYFFLSHAVYIYANALKYLQLQTYVRGVGTDLGSKPCHFPLRSGNLRFPTWYVRYYSFFNDGSSSKTVILLHALHLLILIERKLTCLNKILFIYLIFYNRIFLSIKYKLYILHINYN